MRSPLAPSPRPPKLLPAGLLRLVSDERLVEQIRAGSERAFEALFDRHHRRLLAFCRHMLRSREEAEEVVQDTFLAAYCDFLRSDKPIAPRPWLFTIARNRCVSILRSQRERAVDEEPLVVDNVAAEVDRREDLRGLLADVARLPDDQRAALLLTELSGVPHTDIGGILGCRQEQVKALVFQARSSLAADRTARETPCHEIRTQLATLHGGALRRGVLRRHVRDCPGCREFQAKVRLQRRQLGALLPAGPGLGLTAGLPGAVTGSGAVGLGGVTLKAGALGSSLVARVLVGAALTSGGAVAGVTAVAHGGATPAVSPAASAAEAEPDVRRANVAQGPEGDPAVAEGDLVPWRVGGPVRREAEEGLRSAVRMPGSGAVGSMPGQAAGENRLSVSATVPAATGDEASEPAGRAGSQEPAEPAQEPVPLKPSSPAGSDEPGKGPAAGSSESQPHGSAGHGPPPWAGGPAASEPPRRASRGRSRDTDPHGNRPEPAAGQAGADGRPEPPSHSDAEAAAAHAKPHPDGPPKPASPAASDHAPPSAASSASPPGAGATPGGSGQGASEKHAPGDSAR